MLDVFQVDPSQTAQPPEPDNFTGPVRMQNLHKPAGAESVEALIVHFPAGARTRPHTHPGEQVLHFVRGSGFVDAAVLHRSALAPGESLEGPAVIEEEGSTTFVEPGMSAEATDDGTLLVHTRAAA